jgi:hypothetical protein
MKSIIYALPEGQTTSQLPSDLIEAYHAAHFCVFAEKEFILRIGRVASSLSTLYSYGYITACDPEGKQLTKEANEINHTKLIDWARLNNLQFQEGAGCDPQHLWPEEKSLLIESLSLEKTIELGRLFNQNAVVWCDTNKIPQLIILR